MAASRPVVPPMVSMAGMAARKSLEYESRTAPPAPMAVRGQPPKPLTQGLSRRTRSSASRAADNRPAPVRVNCDASVFLAAPGSAVLVRHARAVPGGWPGNARRPPVGSPPHECAAISGAINLTAVAATAKQRPGAAFRADEQPRRRGLVATGQRDTARTVAVGGAILTSRTCPARREGTAPTGTARLRSAPCLFFVADSLLPCHPPRRQAVRAMRHSIKSPRRRSHPGIARHAAKVPNRRLDAGSDRHRHR